MLLTLTTTHPPATDLGYLLHKHPQRVFEVDVRSGQGWVFFPEASAERCTAALLVELDPVELSRGKASQGQGQATNRPLEPYVNDRPYAASSVLSAALRQAFGTAMTGRSKERPELAAQAIPLEATLPALPSRGGADLVARLFGPLGYEVQASPVPLDPAFPEWGDSPYLNVTLRGTLRLRDLLSHLYVLIPVLDDTKHYFVDEAEIDKLLRHGGEWLAGHPERDLITRRYLKHRRALLRVANEQLRDLEPDETRPLPLNEQRLAAVAAALLASGATSVLDLGCGEGNLLARLLPERQFTRLLGVDVSVRALERAAQRLRLDELPETVRARLTLVQGSLTYRDARLRGFDAAALVEVIEHLDEDRLWTLERVVFGDARPGTVVVTTPNAEYNATWERLPAGTVRHADHRFEWSRAQFAAWTQRVAADHGYSVTLSAIGDADPHLGPPTQMAVFQRAGP